MKLTCLATFIYAATIASAQLTAPTRNYNVTSPVTNGPYVIGQILPCTYRLFSDVDTSGKKKKKTCFSMNSLIFFFMDSSES